MLLARIHKYLDLSGLQLYNELQKEYWENVAQNKKHNCPNCGAPISGLKCEYCGTNFKINVLSREIVLQ